MSVLIGLDNLVYAKLINDSKDQAQATYDAVKRISGAISANVNPNASSESLFADDGPYETASTIGQISLELNVADLPMDVQAELFGHVLDTNTGIMVRKSNDMPPWVAIGFKSLKSNGNYRYTWLAKGKFTIPEQNNATKGDSISFNTPTTTGTFVKRESDNEWERHADEDAPSFVQATADNWFNGPYVQAAS